jgi:DNA polymerase I-like protein with 3'-5' exonuclease and polymerase domains
VGPQDPKDVSRDIARDLSSVVRELAAVSGDAHHWLKGPEYAKRDAKIVVELHKHLESRLKGEALWKVYKLENRVRPAVDAMERYGVAMHRDRLEEMIAEATEEAERLKVELAEEWGINPGSGKQLTEHFALGRV